MEKKVVQDIVASNHRSIRKVEVPEYREVKINRKPPRPPAAGGARRASGGGKRRSRLMVWVIAVICLIVLIFSVTLLFSSALVKVTPKVDIVTVKTAYSALKNPKADELRFDLMTIEKEGSLAVGATTVKDVSAKAHGQVTIFNNFSSTTQILAKSTRLENAKGKIYRIGPAVAVPGKMLKDGKVIPGSVTVEVTADEAGSDYNMALADLQGDFTIPGFKGSPKYDKFFARLKTAITGGQKGPLPSADEKSVAVARAQIDNNLKEALPKEAFAQLPDGFILFPDAYYIEFVAGTPEPVTSSEVKVVEKAILHGVIFNKKLLASKIAPQLAQKIAGDEVEPQGLESLSFNAKDKTTLGNPDLDKLDFSLSGTIKFIYLFSEAQLKKDLAGKNSRDLPSVLTNYPGVKNVDVTLNPIWRRSFPSDAAKITIQKLTP